MLKKEGIQTYKSYAHMTSAGGGREDVGAEAGVRGGGGQREEGAVLGPGLRSLGCSWRLQ